MRRLLLLTALLLPAAAHAQIITVYGTFSPTHLSGVENGGSTSNPTTAGYWTPNVGGGITFGILPLGPVHIGLDLRGSTKTGTNGSDLILAGPRVALKLPLVKFKPYVEAAGGYLRTRTAFGTSSPFTGQTNTSSFGAYEILGGVDYPLAPVLDLRVFEIGGGKGYYRDAAASAPNYTVSLFTISTGLTVHF